MKENQKNNGKGIFYGVIGVATLVVAIIGATFAYFTATVSNNGNNITGNMATIQLGLSVEKVTHADDTNGLIPMSNSMIEAAVNKSGTNESGTQSICVDDNGNPVCQIYSITVSNKSTAAVFIDGYTALRNSTEGNTGTPEDIKTATKSTTTMRWAQVFPDNADNPTTFTTGLSATGNGGSAYNLGGTTAMTWSSLDPADKTATNAHNVSNIKTTYDDVVDNNLTIGTTNYNRINKNYIRISDHSWSATNEETFDRTGDITSALVFSQRIAPRVDVDTPTTVTYYIAVWLSETGKNQNTAAEGQAQNTGNVSQDFFTGYVQIISSSGSAVSGTFQGLTAYNSTTD